MLKSLWKHACITGSCFLCVFCILVSKNESTSLFILPSSNAKPKWFFTSPFFFWSVMLMQGLLFREFTKILSMCMCHKSCTEAWRTCPKHKLGAGYRFVRLVLLQYQILWCPYVDYKSLPKHWNCNHQPESPPSKTFHSQCICWYRYGAFKPLRILTFPVFYFNLWNWCQIEQFCFLECILINWLLLESHPKFFYLARLSDFDFGGRYTSNNMECFKAPSVRPTHQWFNQYQSAMSRVYKGQDR